MSQPNPETPASPQEPVQPSAAGQPYPAGPGYPASTPPGYPASPPPGYPPYPGPGYPPPYPVAYLRPSYNTYAILSLVLAIAVFPPLGLIFGYKARKQIAQTGESGGELATAGIVVGWILTSLLAFVVIIWLVMAIFIIGGSAATAAG